MLELNHVVEAVSGLCNREPEEDTVSYSGYHAAVYELSPSKYPADTLSLWLVETPRTLLIRGVFGDGRSLHLANLSREFCNDNWVALFVGAILDPSTHPIPQGAPPHDPRLPLPHLPV